MASAPSTARRLRLFALTTAGAALSLPTSTWTREQAVARTRGWIEQAVIQIGLCPYASKPFYDETIRQATTHHILMPCAYAARGSQ